MEKQHENNVNSISEMTLDLLAEYLVEKCPHVEWDAGTLTIHKVTNQTIRTQTKGNLSHGWYPVLTDPATLGCLMDIVRRLHGPTVYVTLSPKGWIVWKYREEEDPLLSPLKCGPLLLSFPSEPTEAHALAKALWWRKP